MVKGYEFDLSFITYTQDTSTYDRDKPSISIHSNFDCWNQIHSAAICQLYRNERPLKPVYITFLFDFFVNLTIFIESSTGAWTSVGSLPKVSNSELLIISKK